MTKQELEQKIEELQKQLDELKNVEVEGKQKKWKPAVGEEYYYITSVAKINWYIFDDDEFDNGCVSFGNYFKTKEEAEFALYKIKYTQMFKRFVEEHSDLIDWENKNQMKWYMYYDFAENQINLDYHCYVMEQGTIYASSEQILKEAVAYVGEDNVKKYVLGVE